MQGKGIIKALFAVLILVTLYQVLLWFQTNKVEKAGERQCNGDSSCYSEYLDSVSNVNVFQIPLIRKFTYSDLKGQQIGLGLDLKGGMSATLQVDLQEHLRKVADKKKGDDPVFDQALANTQSKMASVQSDFLTVFAQEWDAIAGGRKLGEIFSFNDKYSGDITLSSTTAEVVDVLREDTKNVVKQTYNMLLQRIDRSGLIQPNLTLDESRELIMAELPGVENPRRAEELLTGTAKLEFWKTYDVSTLFKGLQEYNEELKKAERDSIMDDSTFALQAGPLFETIRPSGFSGPIFGLVNKNKVGKAMEYLNSPNIKRYIPADAVFKIGRKTIEDADGNSTQDYQVYVIKAGYDGEAPLKGDIVRSASVQTDPQSGTGVSVQMQGDGPTIWCEMTTEAFQNKSNIAIALDDEVVSAPSVTDGPICGGTTFISGGFTVQEAGDLADILEIGSLPAAPKIIQKASVGPTLGKENIKTSVTAIIVGFILVLLFMIAYYSGSGIVSILALLANIVFIFAGLSSQGAIMTLPGIAGIVLTIGMAVDANVIIYERIREELRNDKSLLLAIKDGFRHSYSAIIDANVTTLLTAAVLSYFGMGPVKGFAIVLIWGVIMSVITAVLLGRLIIDWWTIDKQRNLSFSMGWSEKMFANLDIDWMGKRKFAYAFSAIVIGMGLISMYFQGFDLGVDFAGGHNYTVEFPAGTDVDTDKIKKALTAPFNGNEPIVKTFDGTNNRFAITTKYGTLLEGDSISERVMDKLHAGINTLAGGNVNREAFENPIGTGARVITSNIVGPTIADDIRDSSIKATLAALLLIFLYIFIRFRKWQFSLGAVAALFHDVLFTLGIFSMGWKLGLFSMEIDQAFIAAILTVVGYSINDTVVVFDRIREYINTYSGKTKTELINAAVSSTVSRTVITSLTTLFVILILFVFGSGSIKGFAFALLIGVIIGTYSSIFIATPLVHDTTSELLATEKKKEEGSTLARKKAINVRP
jgi:SecD/SecF fusion protein